MRHRRAAFGSIAWCLSMSIAELPALGHPDTEVHGLLQQQASPIRYRMLYYPPESAEGCFIRFRNGRSFVLNCRFHNSPSLINPGDQAMTPTNLPLSRSAAIPAWLAAAMLAASLFASSPNAHADDYDDCMIDCIANGGSVGGCHELCE